MASFIYGKNRKQSLVKIVTAQMEFATPDPFGPVLSGFIHLFGNLRKFSISNSSKSEEEKGFFNIQAEDQQILRI